MVAEFEIPSVEALMSFDHRPRRNSMPAIVQRSASSTPLPVEDQSGEDNQSPGFITFAEKKDISGSLRKDGIPVEIIAISNLTSQPSSPSYPATPPGLQSIPLIEESPPHRRGRSRDTDDAYLSDIDPSMSTSSGRGSSTTGRGTGSASTHPSSPPTSSRGLPPPNPRNIFQSGGAAPVKFTSVPKSFLIAQTDTVPGPETETYHVGSSADEQYHGDERDSRTTSRQFEREQAGRPASGQSHHSHHSSHQDHTIHSYHGHTFLPSIARPPSRGARSLHSGGADRHDQQQQQHMIPRSMSTDYQHHPLPPLPSQKVYVQRPPGPPGAMPATTMFSPPPSDAVYSIVSDDYARYPPGQQRQQRQQQYFEHLGPSQQPSLNRPSGVISEPVHANDDNEGENPLRSSAYERYQQQQQEQVISSNLADSMIPQRTLLYKPEVRAQDLAPNLETLASREISSPPSDTMGSNLPSFSDMTPNAPTAHPISLIQRDLDYSLRKLISIEVFSQMLHDPLGRHKFRGFLISEGREHLLDFWWDAEIIREGVKKVREGGLTVFDVFVKKGGRFESRLPGQIQLDILGSLQQVSQLESPYSSAQDHLLHSMYEGEFRRFVSRKLIEQSQVRLGGQVGDGRGSEGLGDVFCVTNPRLRDHPIVMVSNAFCKLTGYSKQAIIGRNCRFLQGPGTNPSSVQRVRDALNEGREHSELLLNYTREGIPFWNLLCLIPLRNSTGTVTYFVGGQVNVTSSLTSSTKLSFLIGGEASSSAAQGMPVLNPGQFSPEIRMRMNRAVPVDGIPQSSHPVAAGSNSAAAGVPSYGDATLETSGGNQELSSSSNGHLGGLASTKRGSGVTTIKKSTNIFGKIAKSATGVGKTRDDYPRQLLPGAETELSKNVGGLDDQVDYFSLTYQKLLIFRTKSREVLFVTKHLLWFFGLPNATADDQYASVLLHMDFLDIVSLGTKDGTKSLKIAIRNGILKSEPLSVAGGIKILPQSKFASAGEVKLKNCLLHFTPLVERDGQVGAYVCIFSEITSDLHPKKGILRRVASWSQSLTRSRSNSSTPPQQQTPANNQINRF